MNNLNLRPDQIFYLTILGIVGYLIYRGFAKLTSSTWEFKADIAGGVMLAIAVISGCGWIGLINEPNCLGINKVCLGCSFGAIVSLGISGLAVMIMNDNKRNRDRGHHF